MSNHATREKNLQKLMEDNFQVAKSCRKIMSAVNDTSLEYYFQGLASRRSQFALELGEEIAFYSGKEPYIPSTAYERRKEGLKEQDPHKLVKKNVKLHKESFRKYKEALCEIHEGSCREILLRHKAFIENSLFELNGLKKILKYSKESYTETEDLRNSSL